MPSPVSLAAAVFAAASLGAAAPLASTAALDKRADVTILQSYSATYQSFVYKYTDCLPAGSVNSFFGKSGFTLESCLNLCSVRLPTSTTATSLPS